MIVYIIEGVVVAIICWIIIWYYCHQSTPFYVRVLVYFTFLICCLGFIMVPIDVYENSQTQQPNYQILILWKVAYYINFFLCWIVLPMAQEYEDSGQFSFVKRMKDALIINAIIIGILSLGAILIAVYMIIGGGFTFSQIPSTFTMLANIFGLLLVSIFLGTGLTTFPKQFYQKRVLKIRVNRCHLEAEAIKCEQQHILEEIYEINKYINRKQLSNRTDQEVKVTQLIQMHFNLTNFQSYAQPQDYSNTKTATFHKIVKRRALEFEACQSRIDELVDEVKSATQSFSNSNYRKQCVAYTTLFIVTTIISIIILWGQICTFLPFLHPFNLLQLLDNSSFASYTTNCLLLGYMTYLVVHSVFRVKVYRVFQLHKKHSASSSLIFTSINLSRICFPLCYNYINIIGMPKASFVSLFGQISFPEEYTFISYMFPVLMILFALLNVFDVYDTLMGYLGLSSYAFDEEEVVQKIEEGRNILMERLKARSIENNNLLEMIQLL